MSRADHLLALYGRSRHLPAALAAVAGSTAALWAFATVVDDARADRTLGLSAVVAGVAAAGHGLAGADVDLERTAAIRWPPWRAVHIALVVTVTLAAIAATTLTEHPVGRVAVTARNAAGAGGLVALAATTLGAHRAWVPVVVWLMAAPPALDQLPIVRDHPGYAEAFGWPAQPASSGPAVLAAVVLALAGTLTYALRGPRS